MDLTINTADEASLRKLEGELADALDFVRKSLARLSPKPDRDIEKPAPKPQTPARNAPSGSGGESLKSALAAMGNEFSTIDLMDHVAGSGKTASGVRFFLRQKVDEGVISVVSPGVGRRPTLYRKMIPPTQ